MLKHLFAAALCMSPIGAMADPGADAGLRFQAAQADLQVAHQIAIMAKQYGLIAELLETQRATLAVDQQILAELVKANISRAETTAVAK